MTISAGLDVWNAMCHVPIPYGENTFIKEDAVRLCFRKAALNASQSSDSV